MRSNPLLKNMNPLQKVLHYIAPVLAIVTFICLWQAIAVSGNTMLPTPFEAAKRTVTVWSSTIAKQPMIVHVLTSVRRILTALAAAVLFGVPFGVALGWSKIFRAVFKPIFEIIRPIPPIAWVPLVTLWFGTGETPRILIIFLGVLMPIVVNSYAGVSMVNTLNIDVGRAFGAGKLDMLFDIVLPSSLSAIFVGIRTAVGTGWMVLLAAEMLAATSGIGFLIMQGSNANDLELSIVGMLMIGLLGALFAYGFDFIERMLCPWKKN